MSPLNSFRNYLYLISSGAKELGLGIGVACLSWRHGRWSGERRGPTCPIPSPPTAWALTHSREAPKLCQEGCCNNAYSSVRDFLLTSSWSWMLGLNIPMSSLLSAWIVFSLEAFCHIFGDKLTLGWWADGLSKVSLKEFAHGWEDAGIRGTDGLVVIGAHKDQACYWGCLWFLVLHLACWRELSSSQPALDVCLSIHLQSQRCPVIEMTEVQPLVQLGPEVTRCHLSP